MAEVNIGRLQKRQEEILKQKYLGMVKLVQSKRPFLNREKQLQLAELLTADVLKEEILESIPEQFVDDFPQIRSEVSKVKGDDGKDIEEQYPKNVVRKALDAFNSYNALFGEQKKYNEADLNNIAVKKCIKNVPGLVGKKYVGFQTKDGRKFRWLL